MKQSPSPAWSRVIIHADMDAFFAAVEELDNPQLRGQPIVIGGATPRSVVATANYRARQFGIGSAMPMVQAQKRCRHLVIVRPRMDRYRAISKQVMAVFARYTDLVEPLSLDEAFLDVTGATANYATPVSLGQEIKQDVFKATGGLTISVGISTTKSVAKIASDMNKPDGLTIVPPHEVIAFLTPLPIKRLWGAGPKSVARMNELGLYTIGDIASASHEIIGQLGRQGQHYTRLANGMDLRVVKPRGRSKSIGWERTLAVDIEHREAIIEHLREASIGVSERMSNKNLRANGIRLKLKTVRFETITRQTTLIEPTDQACHILTTAIDLLDQLPPRGPYRLVGLTGFDLIDEREGVQLSLAVMDGEQKV
jgi:DNA polymerase-4